MSEYMPNSTTDFSVQLPETIRERQKNDKLNRGSTFQNMITAKYANQASQILEVDSDSRPSSFDNQPIVHSGKSTKFGARK